jgi:type II secretory pathway pseudopilin PulG
MTMIELLIVVAVMVIMMGIALPVMKTGIEGRKLREAARQVNVCVELAKGISAETGLPSAILIEPEFLPGVSEPFAVKMYLAETPLPYSGDVVNAKAYVVSNSGTGTVTFGNVNPAVNPAESMSIATLGIEHGDLIRFDYKGPTYQLQLTQPMTGPADVLGLSGSPLPPTGIYSYQIFRQPQKSGAAPLELPKGAVIDLSASGLGVDNQFSYATNSRPIRLVFAPSGRLMRITYARSAVPLLPDFTPTFTVHLLVGNLENLGILNLSDPTTLWVSIGQHSGRVTTAENGGTPSDYTLETAREFAQSGAAMGGR